MAGLIDDDTVISSGGLFVQADGAHQGFVFVVPELEFSLVVFGAAAGCDGTGSTMEGITDNIREG